MAKGQYKVTRLKLLYKLPRDTDRHKKDRDYIIKIIREIANKHKKMVESYLIKNKHIKGKWNKTK